MNLKFKLLLASALLVNTLGVNSQTITVVTGATPISSPTIGAGSSAHFGAYAGTSSTGGANAFVGFASGLVNTTGSSNSFLGTNSGYSNTNGSYNTFLGQSAGNDNTSGQENLFTGFGTGSRNTTGNFNVFLGSSAGNRNNGSNNVCVGRSTGFWNVSGNENVYIGNQAGFNSTGGKNVFIGYFAGYNETGSEKLYIDNSLTATPLIWGDFAQDQLKLNAKVGIGSGFGNYPTTSGSVNVSNYNLFVKGGILTEEIRVSLANTWADYVFKKDYKLPTLQEVEKQIQEKGHLINVPSAEEVKNDGIELGEMAKIQQEKIEELTLYIIEQNKINEKQSKLIEQLTERLNKLENK